MKTDTKTSSTTKTRELSPEVKQRQAVERRIVKSFASEMIAQGYLVEVDNGEESREPVGKIADIMAAIMATDEDRLYVYKPGDFRPIGSALFVYGNGGWDVMSDYRLTIEPLMPKTLALIDKLS